MQQNKIKAFLYIAIGVAIFVISSWWVLCVVGAILAIFGLIILFVDINRKEKAEELEEEKNRQARLLAEERAKERAEENKRLQQIANERELIIRKKVNEFNNSLSYIQKVDIDITLDYKPIDACEDIAFKSTNITRATKIANIFPLVVIDIETTGLSPYKDEIVEVSAIKYNNDFMPVSCFTTLCKPHKHIPANVTAINGITDDMVLCEPYFSDIIPALTSYISGCNIVGHNSIRFDLPFLQAQGVHFDSGIKYYDTMILAKHIVCDVDNYKLVTLCDHFGIYRDDAHRSLSDAYATALVFENLIDEKVNDNT